MTTPTPDFEAAMGRFEMEFHDANGMWPNIRACRKFLLANDPVVKHMAEALEGVAAFNKYAKQPIAEAQVSGALKAYRESVSGKEGGDD